ncbi:MAG: hypothetical protein WBW03_22295, partial [Silvibacterium sp.]
LPNCLFGDTPGIESRGTKVVEYDCGSSPNGEESEHYRGGNNEPDSVGLRGGKRLSSWHGSWV